MHAVSGRFRLGIDRIIAFLPIVQTAGNANTKFTRPKPNEASRAVRLDAPD